MVNSCQNWPLSRLADLCWKIPQKAISRIDSWIFSSSHYIVTLVINIAQYEKGDEWILANPWPTKYTAVYVTFWRPKLRGQFSENLVLWIYEFLFNFGDGISKEKNSGSSENSKFKNDRKFQLAAYLITLFFLFVINKQGKTEVSKQPLKQVLLGKKLKSWENPWKTILTEFSYW